MCYGNKRSLWRRIYWKVQCLGHGEEADQGYHGETTLGIGLECRWRKCCQVYKTVTDGDELFTMQPNFGAKMVKDKTRTERNKPYKTQSFVRKKRSTRSVCTSFCTDQWRKSAAGILGRRMGGSRRLGLGSRSGVWIEERYPSQSSWRKRSCGLGPSLKNDCLFEVTHFGEFQAVICSCRPEKNIEFSAWSDD